MLAQHRVLVTGGAGFIGSRLVRSLANQGCRQITVFDNLLVQVHGSAPKIDLPATVVIGDVRDGELLSQVIRDLGPTIVVHLAAETGTGQSADEPTRYTEVNVVGTAKLIEAIRDTDAPVERLLLASSRAVYGEGAYHRIDGSVVVPGRRRIEDLRRGRFDPYGMDGERLIPIPTAEGAPVQPSSVYGSTKLMQEYLITQVTADWRPVILRLQNVYGPGQSLQNPYTGVLSIFCQQALEGCTLNIFEDGEIVRDFVFVDDVVRAFIRACEARETIEGPLNIGTGRPTTIRHAAETILQALGRSADDLRVTGDFRAGDIRYALADIRRADNILQWIPSVPFEVGALMLADWCRHEFGKAQQASVGEESPSGAPA